MGAARMIDAVTSVLSTDDGRGKTADDIAAALKLSKDGAALQAQLEDLVHQGMLERRGIGRGALYMLATPMRVARALRARANAGRVSKPTSQGVVA